MGDKSPKSVQKTAGQKQSKNNATAGKKAALITSQQATKAKAAANKKKSDGESRFRFSPQHRSPQGAGVFLCRWSDRTVTGAAIRAVRGMCSR